MFVSGGNEIILIRTGFHHTTTWAQVQCDNAKLNCILFDFKLTLIKYKVYNTIFMVRSL